MLCLIAHVLFHEEAPSEPMAHQIWQLLHLGFSRKQLKAVLQLLLEIPWSTMIVEQMHACMSAVHRHHPEYAAEVLIARSFLLMLRKLLPHMTEDEKHLERLYSELCKLNRRQPGKTQGRHLFLSELVGKLREKNSATGLRKRNIIQVIFKRHMSRWSSYPPSLRRDYEVRQQMKNSETKAAISDQADCIRAEKELLLERMEQEHREHKPISMSAAAMTEQDLFLFSALQDSKSFQGSQLVQLRKHAMHCPAVCTRREAELAEQVVWQEPHLVMPEWAGEVAAQREHFRNTVLIVVSGDGKETFWKFLYAVLSPNVYVAVSQLRNEHYVCVDDLLAGDDWSTINANEVRFHFHTNFADNGSAADMPAVSAALFVYSSLIDLDRSD